MLNVDQIRIHQEQRLAPALEAWNEAKRNLESALALAQTREREYREVCADVRKRLDAVDLVVSMAKELVEIPGERLIQPAASQMLPAPDASKDGGAARRTSRALFPPSVRARVASLSILQ